MRVAKSFRTTSVLLASIGVLYIVLDLPVLTDADTVLTLADIGWLTMSVTAFLVGSFGILSFTKPERMGICFVLGIISFVLIAGNGALAVYTGRISPWFLLTVGLPLFYAIEARTLKKLASSACEE